MRKIYFAAMGLLLLTGLAYAATKTSINFGVADLFTGNAREGSISLVGKKSYQRTALDLWPVNGESPPYGALTELVLYRTRFKDQPAFERMNWTAMNHNEPMYRFGVERSVVGGYFRPIWFCFEDVSPGAAYCPLKIEPPGPSQGVYTCNAQNQCTKVGG